MKNIIALSLMLASMTASAQEQSISESPKQRKNEIGLTMQTDAFSYAYNNTSLQALQFKRWKNEHFGARFLVGHASYYTNQDFAPTYQVNNDTIIRKQPITNGNMGFVGFGLEAQRQFYKRVILFAAIEAQVGYGNARVDTAVEYSTKDIQFRPFTNEPGTMPARPDATTQLFYVGITPTIGAKIEFNRINFGTEFALNLARITNRSYPGLPSINTIDIDLGNINPRFFVHYRF